MSIKKLRADLQKNSNSKKKQVYQKFFKTEKGEYGEGDKFLGITVPICRKIARKYKDTPLIILKRLISSKFHEERLVALLILIAKYEKGGQEVKNILFNFYLENTKYINNWDLVDLSAYKIIGRHLIDRDKKILYKLAKSKNLWEKRMSIISTLYFIKNSEYEDTLKISKLLLNDEHDLIHKAVGWMLREVGKNDLDVEEKFLRNHYKNMPRTMLRYAIEKFPEKKREAYLKDKI